MAKREMIPRLARSRWAEQVLAERFPFGEGITGWAVEHREPVLANQAHLDPRVRIVPGTPAEPEALIVVPLIARGSLKGTLNIYREGEDAASPRRSSGSRCGSGTPPRSRSTTPTSARASSTGADRPAHRPLNHRAFHERLRKELLRASSTRDTVALVMLDLDDFKGSTTSTVTRSGDRPGADRRRPPLVGPRRRTRLPDRRRGVRDHRPLGRPPDRALLAERVSARVGEAEYEAAGRLTRLGRCRARARSRREPARAGRLRRGGDDDGEGARQAADRRLRRGDGAARGAAQPRRHPLDRAPEDAAEPFRQAHPPERRARDRHDDRQRAPAADRLPQLPRLPPRGRRARPMAFRGDLTPPSPGRRSPSARRRRRAGSPVTWRRRASRCSPATRRNCGFGDQIAGTARIEESILAVPLVFGVARHRRPRHLQARPRPVRRRRPARHGGARGARFRLSRERRLYEAQRREARTRRRCSSSAGRGGGRRPGGGRGARRARLGADPVEPRNASALAPEADGISSRSRPSRASGRAGRGSRPSPRHT